MPKRRKLVWQFYPTYLLITVLSLAMIAWYSISWLKNSYLETLGSDLTARALFLSRLGARDLSPAHRAATDSLVKKMGSETATRLTIILPTGEVFADSISDPSLMTSHSDRPEVVAALKGEKGHSLRRSYTLKKKMLYAAVPVRLNGRIVAVARAAIPTVATNKALQSVYTRIAATGIVIALLAALLTFLVSRRVSLTLSEIKTGAERFAAGDLFYRMDGGTSEEIGALAETMNRMAEELHEKLTTITSQRNELEAVLLGMTEALIVVDEQEHIMRLNRAAEKLLDVDSDAVRGRTLLEAIRNSDLQRLVRQVLDSVTPVETDLIFPGESDLFLQARGSILKDSDGQSMGAVVVLNDVTRLRTLEKIRKDFVANVSHELKTPVTSIKGFVETLTEGAIDDPDHARRFLDILMRHADRLGMIIEDLLSLSRIEQATERGTITLREGAMTSVLEAVIKTCRDRALEKDISLEMKCDETAVAKINQTLLEQALVNLVDNAVKYSNPGQCVQIVCHRSNGAIVIEVLDRGCGIPREHLGRIFERFYRVDKARSRDVGGTGLGLAIVKHIVNAHKGTVSVQSSLGVGSTFSIRLPAMEETVREHAVS